MRSSAVKISSAGRFFSNSAHAQKTPLAAFSLFPDFAPVVVRKVNSDIATLEPLLHKIVANVCHQDQLYRSIDGKLEFVGVRCCGVLTSVLSGLLRYFSPDIYSLENCQAEGVEWRDDDDGVLHSHVWLSYVTKCGSYLVIDPSCRQLLMPEFARCPERIREFPLTYVGSRLGLDLLFRERGYEVLDIRDSLLRDMRYDLCGLAMDSNYSANLDLPSNIQILVNEFRGLQHLDKPFNNRL